MAKVKRTIGTGITAQPRTSYSGEDMGPALQRFLRNWSNLQKKGGGQFGGMTYETVEFCRADLEHVGDRPYERDSPEWFSHELLKFHRIIMKAIAEGHADTAARFAYEMGYLHSQAHMKGKWEPHALRGVDTVDAAHKGHMAVHGTDEQKRARWQLIYDEWQAEKAKGTKKAALIVAQRHGVSERQVFRTAKYIQRGID